MCMYCCEYVFGRALVIAFTRTSRPFALLFSCVLICHREMHRPVEGRHRDRFRFLRTKSVAVLKRGHRGHCLGK